MHADGGVYEGVAVGQADGQLRDPADRCRYRWPSCARRRPRARARSPLRGRGRTACHPSGSANRLVSFAESEQGAAREAETQRVSRPRACPTLRQAPSRAPDESRRSGSGDPLQAWTPAPQESSLDSSTYYLRRAPMGTSSRKPASTGLPPSMEPATIIPLDSMPRSLRGCRLATITTLRPINCAGE